MSDPIHIRPATASDASALAELGASTFARSFAHSCPPAALEMYLAATYAPAHQLRELADPAVRIFVAELGDASAIAGFAMLREGAAAACVTGDRPIELARLYARADATSRGIGSRLVAACKDDARGRGFRTLWLGVWEHNHGARRFYERHGFHDVGAHAFLLGTDAQTDRVLECAL